MYILVFIFGAVIGSFLNVVIYRLHTGKSINGHSHCLSCGKRLRWYELFPVLSYLALRAQCSGCAAYIPSRYLIVELLTAGLFTAVTLYSTDPVFIIWSWLVLSVLIVTTVYDMYHLIIPNELPIILTILAVAMFAWNVGTDFSWLLVLEWLATGMIAFGFYAGLWLISRGRWLGFGDAKLAFPLGLLLSFSQVFTMIILSFWIGAAVSVALMCVPPLRRFATQLWCRVQGLFSTTYAPYSVAHYGRYFTMKSEIPFAPFLIVSFLLTFFCAADVLSITDYVLTLFI